MNEGALGSAWPHVPREEWVAQLSHCSGVMRMRCGVRSVLGWAWHRPSQWERSVSPLQPPRSCGWVSAERFPPSRLPRAAGGAAQPVASHPGRKASARGSSICPCAAAPQILTPNLPCRQPLRALPYADCPPSSHQRPSLRQGCLPPAHGPLQGSCLPLAFVLPPYLPHTLLPQPQEEAGHTSTSSADLPISLTVLRLTDDPFAC